MNRLAIFSGLLGGGIGLSSVNLAHAREPSRIIVRTYDYAATDNELLKRSQKVASSILGEAGIEIRWESADLSKPASNSADDNSKDVSPVLLLRLHGDAPAKKFYLKGWQFGYSIPSATGFSDIAGVLVERTSDFARAQGADPHVVLGHVMAHELGHLLLGPGSHATQGIMQHRWRARELRLAQMSALGFTRVQALKMGQQLIARTRQKHRPETAGIHTCQLDGNARSAHFPGFGDLRHQRHDGIVQDE